MIVDPAREPAVQRSGGDVVIEEPPRWPLWYAPAAFLAVALLVTLALGGLALATGTGDGGTPPGVVLAGTLLQDGAFVGVALWFASRKARPRSWHFGLRRVPLRRAAGLTALAVVGFYLATVAYAAILEPTGKQTVIEDLGAERSDALLVGSVLLVVGIAPFAEEFFFRGFFYGALRTRLGVWSAATLDGLLFGSIHYSGPETASVVPPLILLGALFCLLYERTGSLYPAIAFHVLNNAIAFGAEVGGTGAILSAAVGALAIATCLAAGARQRPRAPLPFGTRQWVAAG